MVHLLLMFSHLEPSLTPSLHDTFIQWEGRYLSESYPKKYFELITTQLNISNFRLSMKWSTNSTNKSIFNIIRWINRALLYLHRSYASTETSVMSYVPYSVYVKTFDCFLLISLQSNSHKAVLWPRRKRSRVWPWRELHLLKCLPIGVSSAEQESTVSMFEP